MAQNVHSLLHSTHGTLPQGVSYAFLDIIKNTSSIGVIRQPAERTIPTKKKKLSFIHYRFRLYLMLNSIEHSWFFHHHFGSRKYGKAIQKSSDARRTSIPAAGTHGQYH